MNDTRAWWTNPRLWLVAIVVFAAAARMLHIEWDQNHFFHPDERQVAFTVQKLSFRPTSWTLSLQSPFGMQLDPDFFAYGTLPIYLTKISSSLVSLIDPRAASYDGVIVNGRYLSAIIGTLTVLLLIALGTRLYDRSVGLLAGLLLAACALHIQNSRFVTVDVTLTFFVLLALYQLVRVSLEGTTRRFVVAGACIGLATATKFSALPLFLALGIAALHRVSVERRLLSVVERCALAVGAAVAAFALVEPYALINYQKFIHDFLEQSHMVRNAGAMPFTTQYMHTTKFGYDLEQLIVWCMGPALGLVAVWATVARVGTAWRTRRTEEWVLLAWVIPFFLVTGWFEVKFPRYLLPIYPLMILWAAEWLMRKYRSGALFGRLALPVVVAGTLAAAFAFMSIYTQPHTVVTASEWVFRHVPPGSKILTQDWDEGFPFNLPGMNAGAYKVVAFGYYEQPDSSGKIQRLSREVASSDYIIFQTKRLYGALTRAPERFPLNTNYFYELFAGDLGYTLIHEVAARPSLFGIQFPDELADESLTVYDHPKVLMFQNTEHQQAEAIAEKILRGLPSRPLTRDDLLLARPSSEGALVSGGEAPPIQSSILALVLFAGLVEILSLAVYPVLRRWLTGVGTLALSKTLGVLLFAYVSWLWISVGAGTFTQGTLTVTVLAFAAVGALAWRRAHRTPMARVEIIATEGLFWGAFAFLLAVRLWNPEIFWGEKPMDFSFLNALTRTTALPPPEPWFAGSPLHYSYFGYYAVAALGKTLHLDPALTFNLGIALFAGLTAAAAFAAGALVTNQWQTGVLAAFLTMLVGNLSSIRELHNRGVINFDYFWATSRVIRDTINEFPLWSFLFADLHAHVLVMPFSLTFVALVIIWIRARVMEPQAPRPAGSTAVLLALLCLTLGAIVVTNTWSTPTYILFFLFLLGTVWLTESDHRGALHFLLGGITRVLLPSAVVIAGAFCAFLPYWQHFVPPERNWGWERGPYAMPGDFLTVFGVFLFVLIPFLFALWSRAGRRADERVGIARIVLLLLAVAVMFASLGVSTRAFMIIAFLLGLQVVLARDTESRWRIPAALATFAFAITAGCEFLFVWDRMNTLFKFYLEAWFLMAIASAVAMHALWTGALPLPRLRRVWQVAAAGLVVVAVFTAATDTFGVIRTNRVPSPKPTLDGMAYLRNKAPDELAAYEWLNRNIRGIPVLLEAHGDSYQEFTRVSMNTGLPTVLGWSYHVFQRAHQWPEINRRKDDIKTVYTSESKDTVAAILQRYDVALVFLGGLERRTYAGANLERFREWTDLLTPVYQNPGVTIFAVNGRFAGAMPVTTIAEIPQVEGVEGEAAAPAVDAPGTLHQPRGVAITAEGNVVACDFSNNRVQEFTRDLHFVRAWGTRGELPGQFKEPCGVAVAPNGEVLVADTWNQRVQVFSKTREYVREFAAGFYGPRGVAVDAKGDVFVADTGNNRIVRFSSKGEKIAEWGGKGSEPGKFLEPVGIAVDTAGQVYIADNGNGRLQIFTRDGQLVKVFPVSGWESKVYSEPYVAIDPKGMIWVTIPGAKEVRSYDLTGKLLRTVTGQSVPGAVFEMPMGIAFSPVSKEFVIADLENRLVRLPYADH